MTSEPPLSFEEARERLRLRGYLDRGVEGAVLKGALAARTRTRGLLRAAFLAALLLAFALAAVQAVLIAFGSGLPPLDAAAIFFWLFGLALVFGAVVVAVLMGIAWARGRTRRDADEVTAEIGVAFGLAAGAFAALAAAPALEAAGATGVGALLLAVAFLVFLSVRIARSVTLTVLVTSGRAVLERRHRTGAVAALSVALLAAAGAWVVTAKRGGEARPEEPLVVPASASRVLLIGVDGWSDGFVPPGSPGLGPGSPYRKDGTDPAAFWTTVATGEGAARHGVGALDLVRVRGLSEPVKPAAGTGWYLRSLLPALGLARQESATSASRRVPAIWEVAQRAGIPAAVVGWWTTYPASGPATVLSNHLFFAARAGSPLVGEGWPVEAATRAAAFASRTMPAAGTADRLAADAQGLDAFAARAFLDLWERERPRLGLVYLPGLDILASALADLERSPADKVVLARALSVEAERVRLFLALPLPGGEADLRLLLLDGGRHERSGRVVASGPLAARTPTAGLRPADVAPTALAAMGIPAARDLEGHVVPDLLVKGIATSATSATVATWGRKDLSIPPPIDPKEYVENLRSLGYLK